MNETGIDYLRLLARRWKLLLIVPIFLAALAYFAMILFFPRSYEASAGFVIRRASLGENFLPIHPETYEGVILNQQNFETVVREFNLGAEPLGLSAGKLMKQSDLIVQRNGEYIELEVLLGDQKQIAPVVARLAELAIAGSRALDAVEREEALAVIEQQVQDSRKRLDAAESEFLAEASTGRKDEYEREVDMLLDLEELVRKGQVVHAEDGGPIEGLETIDAALAETEAEIAALEEQLAEQKKILALQRVAGEGGGEYNPPMPPGTPYVAETVNPVYADLEPRLIELRAKARALQARKNQLSSEIKTYDPRLAAAQQASGAAEVRYQKVEKTFENMSNVYGGILKASEEARIDMLRRSERLILVDPPIEPERYARPRTMVNSAIVWLLAALGLVLYLLAREEATRQP